MTAISDTMFFFGVHTLHTAPCRLPNAASKDSPATYFLVLSLTAAAEHASWLLDPR